MVDVKKKGKGIQVNLTADEMAEQQKQKKFRNMTEYIEYLENTITEMQGFLKTKGFVPKFKIQK